MTQLRFTEVTPMRKVEVVYEEQKGLFGLIKWWNKLSSKSLEEALCIACDKTPDKVFINGIEYSPKNT